MTRKGSGRKPKLANCSPNDVFNALKKIGGFAFDAGAKHDIIIHVKTGKKSTLPRTIPINRFLLKDFVDDYLIKELGYSEKEVYKNLWC